MKRNERILVVEDDPHARAIMADVLADEGYTVEEAQDGYEALSLAAHRTPDLVLSDLMMPGIDGKELIRRLHTFARHLPVILTTGSQDTKDVITSAEGYGAVVCLPKPMRLEELLWTIDRTLALARAGAAEPHPALH